LVPPPRGRGTSVTQIKPINSEGEFGEKKKEGGHSIDRFCSWRITARKKERTSPTKREGGGGNGQTVTGIEQGYVGAVVHHERATYRKKKEVRSTCWEGEGPLLYQVKKTATSIKKSGRYSIKWGVGGKGEPVTPSSRTIGEASGSVVSPPEEKREGHPLGGRRGRLRTAPPLWATETWI